MVFLIAQPSPQKNAYSPHNETSLIVFNDTLSKSIRWGGSSITGGHYFGGFSNMWVSVGRVPRKMGYMRGLSFLRNLHPPIEFFFGLGVVYSAVLRAYGKRHRQMRNTRVSRVYGKCTI